MNFKNLFIMNKDCIFQKVYINSQKKFITTVESDCYGH